MQPIEKLLEQFQSEQAAQIESFKAVLEIVKAQDGKIKELIKERDAAIKDIESMILNVKSNAACRYCKYFLEFDKCEALVFDEGCKPKWRGYNEHN